MHHEGPKGLYKGFWVNVLSIVSGAFYVLTYENVRHLLQKYQVTEDTCIRALFGGGCASLVAQTIIVPVDVISQHLMMMGQAVQFELASIPVIVNNTAKKYVS